MGSFNRLMVECPNCRHHNEVQSKGGDCSMSTYHMSEYKSDAPIPDVVGLAGHDPVHCAECGIWYTLEINVTLVVDAIQVPVFGTDRPARKYNLKLVNNSNT